MLTARFLGPTGRGQQAAMAPKQPGWGAGQVFCRACGRAINAAAPICPGCGAPQAVAPEGEKSRVVAAVLQPKDA